ncbi:putative damage-inducible protein DinB [Rhizobium aquaticum]|uniref:Damage-inducible protein DinB n=1 Tax=Rhizobium aquaticum TaxID=1549636 RepID=A0ABV2J6G9_9HYPH
MSTQSILLSLFDYKAMAASELFDALKEGEVAIPADNLRRALRILNHAHIVDCIFLAHLEGRPHGCSGSWEPEAPALTELALSVAEVDGRYRVYLASLDDEALDEVVAFTFTDGQAGRMTRAEIFLHVATHSGYHRGEAGSLVPEVEAASMRDVFAGYLHRAEPARREEMPRS